MATVKAQDDRSAFNFSSITSGFAASLSGLFQAARDRVITPYRERLCEAEKRIYDEFHLRQERHPEHKVFLVISTPTGERNLYESATREDAQERTKGLKAKKDGSYAYIALDLSQSFESQWSRSPDGTEQAISCAKDIGYSSGAIILPATPNEERRQQSAQRRSTL